MKVPVADVSLPRELRPIVRFEGVSSFIPPRLASSGRRLRLLIVNYEFPPLGGGASVACYGLARTLASRGHHVEVLTSRLEGQAPVEIVDGIHVNRVKSWRHGPHHCGLRGAATFLLFAWLRLRRLLKAEKYDLVHYFFGLPTGLLSLYTHGKHNIPYIVSLRGSDVPGYDPLDRPLRISHRLLAPLTRWIWGKAERVVPNSDALGILAGAFEPRLPFHVIPNAVDSMGPRMPCDTSPTQPVSVLCVARLIERKGLGVLLQAIGSLSRKDVTLHIVGSGKQEKELRRSAEEQGLAGRVIFHGSLPNEKVREMCRLADIFVLPTLSESCSMALLEAMSAGMPVITTRAGGNPHLIQDGYNGKLVPPADVDELRAAIEDLVANPAKREAMGRANVQRIAEEFSWSVNADRYEDVYRRVLEPAKTLARRLT